MHWVPSYVFHWKCYDITGPQVATKWTAAACSPVGPRCGSLYLLAIKNKAANHTKLDREPTWY